MQVGDIVSGTSGAAYLALKPLGMPGLFGQAFLCRRTDDGAEVVAKTLRAGRSAADRERFFAEARVLELVAEFERRAGAHYAVRLLDQGAPDAAETFIVLERATGLNVLDDMVERVLDWQAAPLDEHLALAIAEQLARALSIAHQAGICYDDMKLDNLFWDAERAECPLRIIDWNVTSTVAERGGVAGDWARFGARLYELRTGIRIGVSHDGALLGAGPGGALWQQQPDGLRDLVEQALRLRYTDDDILLRDIRREREQAGMSCPQLLDRATIADGAGQSIEVLAPLARAERQLYALPPADPQRETGLARCAELRQRAVARRGIAGARALENALQALARDEPRLAVERFQKAYVEAGSRDPRPRRWLWLARLAVDQPRRYRMARGDLTAGIEALNRDDPAAALQHLAPRPASADLALAGWLLAEAEALAAAAQGDIPGALARFDQLNGALEQYPDLRAARDELAQQHEARQRQERARARAAELWDAVVAQANQGRGAEEQGDEQRAIQHYDRALGALAQLMSGNCSPELEDTARTSKAMLSERLDRLHRQAQVRQIPEQARSPDPRQRRAALKLAEQLLPDWPELPQLREQVRQIDTCLVALERGRGAGQLLPLDQALAAADVLERVGVRLDSAGADLQNVRQKLLERRADLKSGQSRARLQEAGAALDLAAEQASPARYDDALRLLATIDEYSLEPEAREDLRQLAARAAELGRQLERVAEQRDAIARAKAAHEWGAALRLAMALAADNPRLPRLAEEAAHVEHECWTRLATSARQLAEEFQRLTLKQGTSAYTSELELRAIQLTSQRQALDRLGALAREQRTLGLRAEAERATAEIEHARAQWRRRRDDSIAELGAYLAQAESALAQGDDGAAHRIMTNIRAGYLPDDAREQGLEPLLIKVERLDGTLARRHSAILTRLREIEARLDDPQALLWYEDLVEPFRDRPAWLDAEAQATWQRVYARATALRLLFDRARWREQSAILGRLAQLDEALAEQSKAAERQEQRIRQDVAVLREETRRDTEVRSAALAALEEAHSKTNEALRAHRKAMLGTMITLFLAMLVVTMLAVILT